ncbi:conserved hypothetical protein [Paecilomyces variotii No. 5]|uniref:Utp8 beta-propeller domain-containing protein n=1 Tax=Byssochlamys spectabilis (strain No. 5 / NBRC 109023) TaxID=1356009 RepID=V5GAH4_BYSSN|nr:conserved hypothetical protein [Paecilomyces variotii No. 5]
MELQAPSVLAQLPRPLQGSTGKTQIGEVYSLSDSRKRKRYEVAVAVDGEALNIYNVQTPKLVTSYAVPPQSSFSCRPCSVRRKLAHKSTVIRQTYCAVERPEKQIKAFFEESGATTTSAPNISSSSFTLKDSKSPTVFLGIFPAASDEENEEEDSFDVLAVHQDGRVRRLAPDLKAERWSINHSEIAKSSEEREVSAGFLIEFGDAKKSLLKRRPDLAALASGDIVGKGVEEPSVLLLVSHPARTKTLSLGDVKIQIFSVPARIRSDALGLDESQKLRHLMTVSLPAVEGFEGLSVENLQWNFHSGSAGLNLSFQKGFLSIDLSQYSPTVTSQFILEDENFSSVTRISPHSVIGASQSMIALYDTQYQSIQRSIALGDVLSGGSSKIDINKAPVVFVSYFAKLGIAVATKGNNLLAFDLSSVHTAPAQSFKRQRDGLLIDAIGRGIKSSAAVWNTTGSHQEEHKELLGLDTQTEVDKWNKLRKNLESASQKKDAKAFDKAVKSYFDLTAPEDRFINPEKILFVLSKLFSASPGEKEDTTKLAVSFWPSETCKWLINSGRLSMNNVEIAVRRCAKPRILPPFPSGSFVRSLADFDSSLKLLLTVLQGPVTLSTDELAAALKMFIEVVRTRFAALDEPARAITNGPRDETDEMEGVEGASTSKVTRSPESALTDAFTGLNLTLIKLHLHAIPDVIRSIRSTLSNTETLSVIQHLRISLATGGYTTRFTESPPIPLATHQVSPSLTLDSIIDLLSACVDAIGPSGWVSAAGFANELDLIGDMKTEISFALAGVEEASYMKGILREFLRFGSTAITSSNDPTSNLVGIGEEIPPTPAPREKHERLNGAELITFAPPDEDDLDPETGGKMLPLSLKAARHGDVSRKKVKKSTGEVKARSSREIGYLRRKAMGKYAFERLLV